MIKETRFSLLDNSRFYILVMSLLLSAVVAAYLRVQLPSDQLYYIRLQQIFGFLAVVYWYVALVISPISYVIGKHRMAHLEFARRAIGVSAAYFTLLHTAIALIGQIGGLGGIRLLPSLFQWSLVGGAFALIILLFMAATSFNVVIAFMTFRRWKWLHRLVYVGGVLAVLHIWTIGTHLAYGGLQWAAFGALALLSGLETFRVVTLLAKKYAGLKRKDYFFMLFTTFWIAWIICITCIPSFAQNYHTRHIDRNPESTSYGKHHE